MPQETAEAVLPQSSLKELPQTKVVQVQLMPAAEAVVHPEGGQEGLCWEANTFWTAYLTALRQGDIEPETEKVMLEDTSGTKYQTVQIIKDGSIVPDEQSGMHGENDWGMKTRIVVDAREAQTGVRHDELVGVIINKNALARRIEDEPEDWDRAVSELKSEVDLERMGGGSVTNDLVLSPITQASAGELSGDKVKELFDQSFEWAKNKIVQSSH